MSHETDGGSRFDIPERRPRTEALRRAKAEAERLRSERAERWARRAGAGVRRLVADVAASVIRAMARRGA